MINRIPNYKRSLAKKISKDVKRYLSQGGVIKQCKHGESGGGSPLWRGVTKAEKEAAIHGRQEQT